MINYNQLQKIIIDTIININIDNAVLKKDINKNEVIKIDDVELNLPKEVIEARDYQYNLIY